MAGDGFGPARFLFSGRLDDRILSVSSHPTISIITPTRNRRALLTETVASVRAQTLAAWEYLIIDDASEDDTWAWLGELAANDGRIRPIHLAEHGERSRARNIGLAQARGPYALFLDDDDLLFPEALAAHAHALDGHPVAVASIAGYEQFAAGRPSVAHPIARRQLQIELWPALVFGWAAVAGQCLFRTEATRAIGGWDEARNFAEDFALLLALSRTAPAVLLPDLLLRYRVHPGQGRPAEMRAVMFDILDAEMAQAVSPQKAQGRRLLEARKNFLRAQDASRAGDKFASLGFRLQTVLRFPELLLHPLNRRRLFS